jgi:zinc protease
MEGSSASYQTNVSTLYESFSGGSLWSDTEDLLQLMHLRFTTVRKDTTAFLRWQSSNRNNLVQRMENPMTHFSDTLRSVMYEPHPRNRKATLALADSVDYDRTCALFQERFSNAADFTFIFVGHMNLDSIRPLICQYIASLPGNEKTREKANLKALPNLRRGRHTANVHVPMEEPVTTVIYNILAKERYTAKNNIACAILSEVMNSLCTETLREQEGGTYNVSVTSRISRQPADELTLMFNFNTNPQQAKSLLQKAIELLRQVAEEGPSTAHFNKAKEYLQKQYTAYRTTDTFWMDALIDRVRYNSDDMLTNGETLRNIKPKDVQRLARKLVRSKHIVEVMMNGEE